MRSCNQCGKCCIKYADGGLSASTNEIDWWEANRPEIYAYVNRGEIWFDPLTQLPLKYCPWLGSEGGKYTCEIYHDRPEDCRHYPTHIEEMVEDACEMLEDRDLANPDQAQTRLDIIMSDSRPAFRGSWRQN